MSLRQLIFGLCLLVMANTLHADELTPELQAQMAVNAAQQEYAEGNFGSAVAQCRNALNLLPDYLPALQWLTVSAHATGKLDDALEAYWQVQQYSFPELEEDITEELIRERELLIQNEGLISLLVNEDRKRRNLPLLLPDPRLSKVARAHSDEMRDKRYFDHKSPNPRLKTPTMRFLAEFGQLDTYTVGENIASRSGSDYSLRPEAINVTHEELMESKGHRANILGRDYHYMGMGIAVNDKGDYQVTQMFANF